MVKIGYLQEYLIKEALRKGRVTSTEGLRAYSNLKEAKKNFRKLCIKGYLEPKGMNEWKPTQKAKEEYEK